MGVQFGRWNCDGSPVELDYLNQVKTGLSPYGPDQECFVGDGIAILYCAFHTNRESRRERQPLSLASNFILTWDGRLDNRTDLTRRLQHELPVSEATDLDIVAAAYERWNIQCLAMLSGDWALSVWNPSTRKLILAKDPVGGRHLYYSRDRHHITWCTILDPLVLLADQSFDVNEEYVAGWLSFLPAPHLTPYVGIHSVPPSSFVVLEPEKCAAKKYWDFDPRKQVRYKTDGEYEEHFRAVFVEAVRRRLRSDTPVLAELSGGVDSCSIVCVADAIIAGGNAGTPRLDTVSYYNDFEPNWDERPFFTRVEEKRGRIGCHIDVSSQEPITFLATNEGFAATPACGAPPTTSSRLFSENVLSNGNRVVLSGIGGDEFAGGVPTPLPELEDSLARGRIRELVHLLKIWSLKARKPWFYLLFEAAREFLPAACVGVPEYKRAAVWLQPDFAARNRPALAGYEARVNFLGPLPSFQHNLGTLDAVRRQLSCFALPINPCYEKRYPFLDRDFLEFMFAVPRSQVVRPGQRRSLMRRALAGIVPDEILNRKRKAYLQRSSMIAIAAEMSGLLDMSYRMVSSALGFVDPEAFRGVLLKAANGQETPTVAIMRTLGLENWLRRRRCQEPPFQFQHEEWLEAKKQKLPVDVRALEQGP